MLQYRGKGSGENTEGFEERKNWIFGAWKSSKVYILCVQMGCQQLTYKKSNFLKVVHSKNDKTASKNVLSSYRYSFQGQEKDNETGKEAFQLRLWDGRIGRWLTTDPKGAGFSPYWGMDNNPISLTDPDGGCPKCGDGVKGDIYDAGNGVTYYHDGTDWSRNGGTLDEVFIGGGQTVGTIDMKTAGAIGVTSNYITPFILNGFESTIPNLTKSDFLIGRIDPKNVTTFSNSTTSNAMGNVYSKGYKENLSQLSNLKAGIKYIGYASNVAGYAPSVVEAYNGNYTEAAIEGGSTYTSIKIGSRLGPLYGAAWAAGWELGEYSSTKKWYNSLLFGKGTAEYERRAKLYGFQESLIKGILDEYRKSKMK